MNLAALMPCRSGPCDPLGSPLRAREHQAPPAIHWRAGNAAFPACPWETSNACSRTFSDGLSVDPNSEAHRILQVVLHEMRYGSFHRRGETHRLPLFRQNRRDPANRRKESHVQHAIGFVEHQRLQCCELDEPPIEKILQSARSRDDDASSLANRRELLALPTSRQPRAPRAEVAFRAAHYIVRHYLHRQLARRNQHERGDSRRASPESAVPSSESGTRESFPFPFGPSQAHPCLPGLRNRRGLYGRRNEEIRRCQSLLHEEEMGNSEKFCILLSCWRKRSGRRANSGRADRLLASLILDYAEDVRRKLKGGYSQIRSCTRGTAQHNRNIKRKGSITRISVKRWENNACDQNDTARNFEQRSRGTAQAIEKRKNYDAESGGYQGIEQ